MSGSVFDGYGRQACLGPALLSLFPVFVTVAVWMPSLYQLAAGLVGLAAACGMTTVLAHIARSRGRAVQKKLKQDWGALPATVWLRRFDRNLDPTTKQRYYSFLEENVPDWHPPTAELERTAPRESDAILDSAVRWLLEHTRDPKAYPLVLKENISYGFRRNVLGLRPLAVAAALASSGYGAYFLTATAQDTPTDATAAQYAALFVSATLLIWWAFAVTSSWVRDAANAYARALLASCDTPNK